MKIGSKLFLSCFMGYQVSCQAVIDDKIGYVSYLQYRANSQIQDRVCYKKINRLKGVIAAVFDGHGGDLVAEYAAGNLIKNFDSRFANNMKKNMSIEKNVETSLQEAFDDVENGFKTIFLQNIQNIDYQRVGACALATVITHTFMTVANSGDCQGILLGSFPPIKINSRHNAGEKSQQERLKAIFPDEKDIFKCIQNTNYCYVKGRLQPTRSLGDFYLKSPEYNFTNLSVFTGPYITHKPQIKTFRLSSQTGYQRLVLASDGLWDQLNQTQVNQIYKSGLKNGFLEQNLFHAAKQKILKRNKMTEEQLDKIDYRRDMHDDISIIVVDLQKFYKSSSFSLF